MNDYTNKDCCLNCDGFCLWDNDYVCIKQMKILQHGYKNNNGGYFTNPYMNEDIDNTIQTSQTCKDYKRTHNTTYIDEYKKFKEFDKLCKQLNLHVNG